MIRKAGSGTSDGVPDVTVVLLELVPGADDGE
jgi:hypothetical protein